jgi:hypothetical protein
LDQQLNGSARVGLPWESLLAFAHEPIMIRRLFFSRAQAMPLPSLAGGPPPTGWN